MIGGGPADAICPMKLTRCLFTFRSPAQVMKGLGPSRREFFLYFPTTYPISVIVAGALIEILFLLDPTHANKIPSIQ
jgi:hypothetical protein